MVIQGFGGPEVFAASELPKPVVMPGHVLVRVAASSVNTVEKSMEIHGTHALAAMALMEYGYFIHRPKWSFSCRNRVCVLVAR